MLDFFKDMYLEVNGFDMEEVAKEKKEKAEKEKAETIILKKNTKNILFISCLIVFGITLVYSASMFWQNDILGIIISIVMALLEIATAICLKIKKKKTEIAGIIGVILIAVVIFFLPAN